MLYIVVQSFVVVQCIVVVQYRSADAACPAVAVPSRQRHLAEGWCTQPLGRAATQHNTNHKSDNFSDTRLVRLRASGWSARTWTVYADAGQLQASPS